ncbi:hypothetical protein [Ferrimonas pelagia]|uniref:Uncharacterized protein n=1 Tax=Ferrimonas pelagia TaxID=1177826 RepID=A0ABP9ETB5_9GAMM
MIVDHVGHIDYAWSWLAATGEAIRLPMLPVRDGTRVIAFGKPVADPEYRIEGWVARRTEALVLELPYLADNAVEVTQFDADSTDFVLTDFHPSIFEADERYQHHDQSVSHRVIVAAPLSQFQRLELPWHRGSQELPVSGRYDWVQEA